MAFGQFGSAMFINPARKNKRKGTKKKAARKRKGKMPAALKKYWAAKRSGKGAKKMAKKRRKHQKTGHAAPKRSRKRHRKSIKARARRSRKSSWRKRPLLKRKYRSRHNKRGKTAIYRTNPGIPGGGFLKSGVALIKANAVGAAGAAVWDLYGFEPLFEKYGRAKLPASKWTKSLAKLLAGVAAGLVANRFAPAVVKKHAGAFVTASMGIGMRDLIAIATDHPVGTLQGMGSLMYEQMGALEAAPNYQLPENRDDSFDHIGELEEDYVVVD